MSTIHLWFPSYTLFGTKLAIRISVHKMHRSGWVALYIVALKSNNVCYLTKYSKRGSFTLMFEPITNVQIDYHNSHKQRNKNVRLNVKHFFYTGKTSCENHLLFANTFKMHAKQDSFLWNVYIYYMYVCYLIIKRSKLVK